jgi:hypothetical protein
MKAKRGDLAVVVTTRRDYVIGRGSQESVDVDVCEVVSITRDGIVKAVHKASWGTIVKMARWVHPHQVHIVPKTEIDVAAAMEAAAANPWPSGHAGMPYGSLGEVKAVLRPLRRTP